jgi:hypothetical protein
MSDETRFEDLPVTIMTLLSGETVVGVVVKQAQDVPIYVVARPMTLVSGRHPDGSPSTYMVRTMGYADRNAINVSEDAVAYWATASSEMADYYHASLTACEAHFDGFARTEIVAATNRIREGLRGGAMSYAGVDYPMDSQSIN